MAELEAVILAAGQSRRMGRDKLLLPWGTTTILGQLLGQFPYRLFAKTLLVCATVEVKQAACAFPVQIVVNSAPELGKSHSIRLGLEAGQPDRGVMFCVADQPWLLPGVITRLVDQFHRAPAAIVMPDAAGRPANPVIFPPGLRSDLANLSGDTGGRLVIARHPELVERVSFSSADQFADIDTAEHYQQMRPTR